MSLAAFDTKEVEVGGEIYNLRKLKALDGLKVYQYIMKSGMISESGINILAIDADMLMEIILKGVTKGSIQLDQKKFDTMFAGKVNEVYELVSKVLEFNFADEKKDDSE
ncbi:hypothetical protein D3C85_798850 [compost metagenome]